MKQFDAIVVGAGTGGCMVARTIANAGFDVCLVERKNEEDIGDKVCGDAIGRHHFDNIGLDYPSGEELERKILGMKIISPSRETVFRIQGEGLHGFIINRRLFGQRLLTNALDAGSFLLDSTHVVGPIIKDGFITGVIARNLKTHEKTPLQSQIVVDASGFSGVLRKQLPPDMGIETSINKKDVIICYREIRELRDPVTEPDYCDIYLNQNVAPHGYYWVFPEGERKVNVGLGVGMVEGMPNPKTRLYEMVLSDPLFKGSHVIHGGGGHVPTRRPLDCMTGNGLVVIGDAAYQVNPMHGGGIGPSMMGGRLAGETVIQGLEKEDVRRETLWNYNIKYMQYYGAKQAGLDIIRILLQGLRDEDFNYVMKYQVITEDDLLKAISEGEVHLNITEKTRRIFRGLRRLNFLKKLIEAVSLMKKIQAHYQAFPTTPQGLDEWKTTAITLINEAETRFQGDR